MFTVVEETCHRERRQELGGQRRAKTYSGGIADADTLLK
jgi:hypothetical protein